MRKKYIHPTKLHEIEEYTCMECGAPVRFQFGICGDCAKSSRKKAEEQGQDAKAERERQQWVEQHRARRK